MDNWSDVRRRARETRGLLGPAYADAPAARVIDALAEAWDLDVVAAGRDHPLLRGARAAWREEYGLVAVDTALAGPERSFAVAHELGHRVCHPGGCACGDGDVDPADLPAALPLGEGRVWGYNPRAAREREANVFAAELLMPPPALRSRFLAGANYEGLASAFGVSATSILNGLTAALLGGVAGDDAEGEAGLASGAHAVSLDASQRRAAHTDQRRVLVDAGPGTGKTRTLVARIAHLVEAVGVEPGRVLAVTFSNRAADELRGRLRQLVPAASEVVVATFHGYALELLRRFAPQAGLPDDFRVVDDVDAALLLERRLPSLELKHYARLVRPGLYLPALLDACSRMRDELLNLDDLAAGWDADTAGDPDGEEPERRDETLRVLRAYEEMLDAYGLVDYGGLIARAVRLLQTDPSVAAAVRGGLRHVLVDEYQDVNRAGAVLLREIVSGGAHLWAVGDVRQSIYRFRGAAPRNVEAFEQDFPGAARLALEVNYRAAPSLVRLAGAAAGAVTGTPAAWSAVREEPRDGGAALAIAPDKPSELAGIVAGVARSIAAGRRPEDHAVLCRTHRQASEVAAAFSAGGLPTSYLGAFFLRREVKDMLALLEFCHGGDGAALLRLATWPDYALEPDEAEAVLRAARERGLSFPAALRDAAVLNVASPRGWQALRRLARHVEAVRYYPDPAAVLTHYLFGDARYLRDLSRAETPASRQAAAALFQLVVLARGFAARPALDRADAENATGAFLRYVRRLLAEGEMGAALAAAPVAGAVNVLTVHGAKGLEFPVVYVPNLGQGRFPPRAHGGVNVALPPALGAGADADGDDERSLFFVAVSRAQDRLVLSRAERYGSRRHGESELLAALHSAYPLTPVAWPQVGITVEEGVPAEGAGVGTHAVADGDLASALRCPRQHRYRVELGLRGDDTEQGYRLYARLLRAAVGRLRAVWGTPRWPGWEAARAALVEEWEARWPVDDALSAWYRAAALAALQRVYRDLAERGVAGTARYDERHTVTVDGRAVSVRVDAIEEIDGVQSLILERATRRSDDERTVAAALYGAVARTLAPGDPLPVLIRYFDSGDVRVVAQPLRALERHRAGIARAVDLLAGGAFPPRPREAEECTTCPLVFICPG